MKIIVEKKNNNNNIAIVKNNIAIRIAGKVSRYIDASMNHATPNGSPTFNTVFRCTGIMSGGGGGGGGRQRMVRSDYRATVEQADETARETEEETARRQPGQTELGSARYASKVKREPR